MGIASEEKGQLNELRENDSQDQSAGFGVSQQSIDYRVTLTFAMIETVGCSSLVLCFSAVRNAVLTLNQRTPFILCTNPQHERCSDSFIKHMGLTWGYFLCLRSNGER